MVNRSGSTLAVSLALAHRYPGSDFESLPVSSSECLQLHPPYLPVLYTTTFSQVVPQVQCFLLVRSAAKHVHVLRPIFGRFPPHLPHDDIPLQAA